jgi:hypothetical protein
MTPRTWIVVCLSLTAVSAEAAVYSCKKGGVTIYSDKPCVKGDAPVDLPDINFVGDARSKSEAKSEAKMAKDWDKGLESEKNARDKADREWLKKQNAQQDKEENIRSARVEGRVVKGMTPAHVRETLGEPDEVRTQQGEGIQIEVWSYRDKGKPQHTISFREGEVNSVSSRRKKK